MEMQKILGWIALGAAMATSGFCHAAAQPYKDSPYFSGMPSHEIIEQADKEFDAYTFCTGKKAEVVEGRVWRKNYNLKENAKQPSELQITRNYVNALKAQGGSVLYEGKDYDCEGYNACSRIAVGKIAKGDKELWLDVQTCNDGLDYWLTVVEKQAMAQSVTANGLLDALNKDGHVALYINFDTGKATIKPGSKPIIDEIIALLKKSPALKLSIEGHTDNVGDAKSNKLLSESRAKAVVTAIVAEGIVAGRLTAAGWGADKPIADNKAEEGRSKNRRVELVKK